MNKAKTHYSKNFKTIHMYKFSIFSVSQHLAKKKNATNFKISNLRYNFNASG